MNVNPTSSTSAASYATSANAACLLAPSLLPKPSISVMPMDAMALMHKLLSQAKVNDLKAGEAQAKAAHDTREADHTALLASLQKQKDDQETAKTWGIVSKVASVVAIVVSAVLSVVTFGAASALLVAACALSIAAFAESETHVIGKATGNEENSKWISMGLGIASAICSCGAGFVASGATVASQVGTAVSTAARIAAPIVAEVDQGPEGAYISAGLGIGGAIAGGVGSLSTVGNAASSATAAASAGATAVEGGAEVAQGVGDIGQAAADHDAAIDEADATEAKAHVARMNRVIQWVVDGIKETDKSHQRAIQSLDGAIQARNQALVMASQTRV